MNRRGFLKRVVGAIAAVFVVKAATPTVAAAAPTAERMMMVRLNGRAGKEPYQYRWQEVRRGAGGAWVVVDDNAATMTTAKNTYECFLTNPEAARGISSVPIPQGTIVMARDTEIGPVFFYETGFEGFC